MKHFHYTCQGFSHIEADKVCQDASYSEGNGDLTLAIVCDGHGGTRYFRSDVGARLAVEATRQCINAFVADVDLALLAGKKFTAKQAITSEASSTTPTKDTRTDEAFRQLFSSIIYNWRVKIEEHAKASPLTPGERQQVDVKYLDAFEKGEKIEKAYGCTLICCVFMPSYWFAFQIGDGKCLAFDEDGQWSEPIPWDEQCFLNKTTSLCDSNAIDEFRYCYCGDNSHPLAVFLGSDGIDDSFGETENMVNFYIQVLKLFNQDNAEEAKKNISETLSQLSRIGSKDDMSIACVYDDSALEGRIKSLIAWQKKNVEDNLFRVNTRILNLREDLSELEEAGVNNQKSMIDFRYVQKDLTEAFERKKNLAKKWNKIAKELCPEDFESYNDEIGFGEESTLQETPDSNK